MRAEPIQARAIATRNDLLDAARELYDDPEVGRDRLTSALIANRAGKSIGTFYRYFEDEVDIMDAIAPNRDYPSLVLLDKVERWVNDGNSIYDISSDNVRAIVDFLEDAL